MQSKTGIKITIKTIKRYFSMKLLDKNKDIQYNRSMLLNLMDEYKCSSDERAKIFAWFYTCWNSGNWED